MRWRYHSFYRALRPKARKVSGDAAQKVVDELAREIAKSPVLARFGIAVRFLRGRFYIERPVPGERRSGGA